VCRGTSEACRPLAFGADFRARTDRNQAWPDSDAILGALNGGILPPGSRMNGLARAGPVKGALEAEYQALEKRPGLARSVAWKPARLAGELRRRGFKAGTPYQVGQQNCRQYTHTAHQIRGTCR
jgi:surface antigen